MLCDIASGYEQLASRVCGWQIGIIGQIELIAAAGVAPEKRGSCAKKGNYAPQMGRRVKYPWRPREWLSVLLFCPPSSEKWALHATNVHKHHLRGFAKL